LREPILWLGFLAKRPLINDFTSLETFGFFGNFGSELIIAKKMSSFFGA
jgi:hypothetical protein